MGMLDWRPESSPRQQGRGKRGPLVVLAAILLGPVPGGAPALGAPAGKPGAEGGASDGSHPNRRPGGASASISRLAERALEGHPSLAQIRSRIRQARARSAQASAFPDPTLSVGLVNMPFWPAEFNATPMTGLQVTATQPIPWPTKLTLAGKLERARAKAVGEEFSEARLKLQGLIRAVGYEIAYWREVKSVIQEQGRTLDRIVSVVEARYRVNQGLIQDLLGARLERSEVADRLQTIARQREASEARLNALLGRAAGASLPRVTLTTPRRLTQRLDALLDLARRHRPLLARWRRAIDVEKLRVRHARTGYYPDFGVSLGYRFRQDSGNDPVDGMDFWSVGVSVRVPLWSISRTRGRIREAEAGVKSKEHGLADARLQVSRELRTRRDALARLAARLSIYRSRILPEAREALKAATRSYTTGKTDFLSVMDLERRLYRHEAGYWRLRLELARQWALLESAVGTRLKGAAAGGEESR